MSWPTVQAAQKQLHWPSPAPAPVTADRRGPASRWLAPARAGRQRPSGSRMAVAARPMRRRIRPGSPSTKFRIGTGRKDRRPANGVSRCSVWGCLVGPGLYCPAAGDQPGTDSVKESAMVFVGVHGSGDGSTPPRPTSGADRTGRASTRPNRPPRSPATSATGACTSSTRPTARTTCGFCGTPPTPRTARCGSRARAWPTTSSSSTSPSTRAAGWSAEYEVASPDGS